MTLRDYFAANATDNDILGFLNDYDNLVDGAYYSPTEKDFVRTKLPNRRSVQQARYMFADAMLEARK
jgi:hypothetical protein